jgi:T-complex protein 1 subunit gamma
MCERIILLDCPLEYKKLESMASVDVQKEDQWAALLKQEEDYIQK